MPISKLIISYILTALVFFAIDIVWLGVVAQKLYAHYLGKFLTDQVNWTAAIIFYLIFIVGIFIFAILPSVEKGSMMNAAIYGGLFGFMAYATYDLTNLATLKNWPLEIVFIDLAWGTVLTGIVSVAGFLIVRALNG